MPKRLTISIWKWPMSHFFLVYHDNDEVFPIFISGPNTMEKRDIGDIGDFLYFKSTTILCTTSHQQHLRNINPSLLLWRLNTLNIKSHYFLFGGGSFYPLRVAPDVKTFFDRLRHNQAPWCSQPHKKSLTLEGHHK